MIKYTVTLRGVISEEGASHLCMPHCRVLYGNDHVQLAGKTGLAGRL